MLASHGCLAGDGVLVWLLPLRRAIDSERQVVG